MLAIWERRLTGGSDTQFADHVSRFELGPEPGARRHAAGAVRRPAFPPAECPAACPTLEAHYEQLRSQHGDRAVMVVLTGLPNNSDPSRGRDEARRRRRDRQTAQGRWRQSPTSRCRQDPAIDPDDVLAPVDDVKGLAERIDFGKASLKRQPDRCRRFGAYIASTCRGCRPSRQSPLGGPAALVKESPRFPRMRTPITKSLIQLKSSDMFRKKDRPCSGWLADRPTNRQKEVLDAVLPFLDHDDEDVVKHAVRRCWRCGSLPKPWRN